jgi:membrane-associated phospholipid phosphatase
MSRFIPFIVFALIISINTNAQVTDTATINIVTTAATKNTVYKIKPWVDIPVTIFVDAFSFYGMSVIYGRDKVPASEILALNKNDINKFDRPITNNYSVKAKDASDLFFYSSMPLPLLLLIDKKIRKDGLNVGLLFLETMGTTGVLYTSSAMIVNRYRPYAYNPDVSIDKITGGGVKNSFFAGHPALVATSTFFMAKVYTDYHPNMKNKWILYAIAGSASATTGLLRLKGGQHFKTDVIAGIVIGTTVGILVPHLHKNKSMFASKLSLMPNIKKGSTGFTAFYKL